MTKHYKTVGSDGGTKQHVVQKYNEEDHIIDILCDIGVDVDEEDKVNWGSIEAMIDSEVVCRNCASQLSDGDTDIESFGVDTHTAQGDSSSGESVLSKILSAIPWV